MEPLVVPAQQVGPVVVAVRGADHGVDVLARGHVVVEHDPGLVLELDEDHRAVEAVVEGAVRSAVTDPGETGVREMGGDLVHADPWWPSAARLT